VRERERDQSVDLLSVQPPDAAASPKSLIEVCHLESFRLYNNPL